MAASIDQFEPSVPPHAEQAVFPDSSNREAQYRRGIGIVADALAELGYPPSDDVRERWATMFARLSIADTIAEEDPAAFESGRKLVDFLGVPTTEATEAAADRLLAANAASIGAVTVEEHFVGRREEALATVELLQALSGELMEERDAWRSIGDLAVSGIYLDSLLDARQDAEALEAFTAWDLRTGAAKRLVSQARRSDPDVLRAMGTACHRNGLVGYLLSPNRLFRIAKGMIVTSKG
ncbi:MAG: hypothetical protein M3N59_01290 [bacterium]|nr:hypothetical protein [bacterium]